MLTDSFYSMMSRDDSGNAIALIYVLGSVCIWFQVDHLIV